MNCSGKHTAMLLTCVANGWPLDGYAEPDHPLQVAIRAAVEELAGEPVTAVGGGRLRRAAVRADPGRAGPRVRPAGRRRAGHRRSGRSPTRCGRTPSWSAAPAGT